MKHWWTLQREPTIAQVPAEQDATMGALYFESTFAMWTLEDRIREVPGQPVASWKIQDRTAIPAGQYRVKLTWSPHFNRMLPELQAVPGFTNIRMHTGNRAEDTDGCTVVGFQRAGASITYGTTKPAESRMVDEITRVEAAGDEVWIDVRNPLEYAA